MKQTQSMATLLLFAAGEAKGDAKSRLEKVRGKWAKVHERLEAAKDATELDWDAVKGDFKAAYGDVKDDFRETRQWLSDKIEP